MTPLNKDPIELAAEEYAHSKTAQYFDNWKSSILNSQNPTIHPKSDFELLKLGYIAGAQSQQAVIKEQQDLLDEAKVQLEFYCGNKCDAHYNPCSAREFLIKYPRE